MTDAVVDEMWASGLMAVAEPRGGRWHRAIVRRDDRDLDRNGLAGRFFRMDWHRQPAVHVRRGHLPERRGLRGGVHLQRQPRHHGRPVLSQRTGHGRRRRLPAERSVELRLGHRPLAVHRGGFLPDGQRRDALDQRGHSRNAGRAGAARGDLFTDGWHVQGLKGTGSYDYSVADVFVPAYRTFGLFTRTRAGYLARRAYGDDAGDRRRPRRVGARGCQEHARRRPNWRRPSTG